MLIKSWLLAIFIKVHWDNILVSFINTSWVTTISSWRIPWSNHGSPNISFHCIVQGCYTPIQFWDFWHIITFSEHARLKSIVLSVLFCLVKAHITSALSWNHEIWHSPNMILCIIVKLWSDWIFPISCRLQKLGYNFSLSVCVWVPKIYTSLG